MTTELKRTKRSIQRLPQYLAQISSITEHTTLPWDIGSDQIGSTQRSGEKGLNPQPPIWVGSSEVGPTRLHLGQKQRGPIRRRSTILRRRPPCFCKEERYGRANPKRTCISYKNKLARLAMMAAYKSGFSKPDKEGIGRKEEEGQKRALHEHPINVPSHLQATSPEATRHLVTKLQKHTYGRAELHLFEPTQQTPTHLLPVVKTTGQTTRHTPVVHAR
eukprot:g29528.t1